ncbi:MAG: histidine kinase [Gemmatimonadaceae bacterium]|nr:histidine kinase [Chitinophagaceae bacterium]
MRLISLFILFIFIIRPDHGMAQATYNFYNISLDKGLSDPRVNAIVQDRYGFMWFATQNGLNRYDGYNVKSFFSSESASSLPSNNILSLFSDKKGRLWIGTTNGLVQYDFVHESFEKVDSSSGGAAAAVARAAVFDFEEDVNGNLYAGGNAGLFRLSASKGGWENLGQTYLVENRLKNIRRLKFFNRDLLYVTTNGNLPFFELNIGTNKVDSIYYKTQYDDTCCLNMFGLEKLNESEMLAGFLSIGIARFNVQTKKYSIVPGVLGRKDSLLYNTVYDLLKDHNGRVWIASFYFRLAEYLPAEKRVVSFEKSPFHPNNFEAGSVLCIYEDRSHNIWVGTTSRGAYHFNPSRATTRFHSLDVPETLTPPGAVISLAVADSQTLVVGTEKGVSFFDYRVKKFTNFTGVATTGINGPVEFVQCAYTDKKGIVWMGSNRLGLMRYDRGKNKFTNFSRVTKPQPLWDDGITDIVPLTDDKLLTVGFGRPGIFNTDLLRYYSHRNDSLTALFKLTAVSTAALDKQNHVWMGTSAGRLFEYADSQGAVTERTQLISSIGSLVIYKISWEDDKLYLATSKGIVITDLSGNAKLFRLSEKDNSLTDVRSVLPGKNHVWFCNNRRIGKLYPASGKTILLGTKDGFANLQLFSRSLAYSPQGTVLIGTNNGYYEIMGDSIGESETPVLVAPQLTAFRVYDQSLVSDQVVSDLKEIVLNYDQNFFSFDMSAFDYAGSDDIEYAYKLEGFDTDWQYIANRHSGSYTNVPGGDYYLKIRARLQSGSWTESSHALKIHIRKAFWQTTLFRILGIGLLFAIGWLIYRNRIKRVRKDAQVKSDYEIKLNELENSALRTQMNPHFIFNSLNTINSFINSNERVQANQYISKFSKLVRLILDHSRDKKISLKDELEVATLYMQLEQIRFENKFQYKIDFGDIDPAGVEVPPLIIQPFVENAILHGLLPREKEGQLNILVSKVGELLQVIINDNGIGREAAQKIKQRSGYSRKSHGIEITLKRIELFNKEYGIGETVTVKDLSDTGGNPAGTEIVIRLAYQEAF